MSYKLVEKRWNRAVSKHTWRATNGVHTTEQQAYKAANKCLQNNLVDLVQIRTIDGGNLVSEVSR